MVCRDVKTHKARKVNPLILEDADDHALSAIGEGGITFETLTAFLILRTGQLKNVA